MPATRCSSDIETPAAMAASAVSTFGSEIAEIAEIAIPLLAIVTLSASAAEAQSANEIGGRGLGGLLIDALSAPFAVALNAVACLVS